MARSQKSVGVDDGLQAAKLAEMEQQYLGALIHSRDELNRRIASLGGPAPKATVVQRTKRPAEAPTKARPAGKRKPRNYDFLKENITGPMTIAEMLKALSMKPKQEGTLRQVFQNYPGLFKSDGKRPATYTFDASR